MISLQNKKNIIYVIFVSLFLLLGLSEINALDKSNVLLQFYTKAIPVEGKKYSLDKAFDGDVNTCWAVKKDDKNKSFSLDGSPRQPGFDIEKIGIFPGLGAKSKKRNDLFHENYRVKKLKLDTYRQVKEFDLKDKPEIQYFDFIVNDAGFKEIAILDTYKGSKYDDICISEIEIVPKGGLKKLKDYSPYLIGKMIEFQGGNITVGNNNKLTGTVLDVKQKHSTVEGRWKLNRNVITIKYSIYNWEPPNKKVLGKDSIKESIYIQGLMKDGRLLMVSDQLTIFGYR